MANKNPYAKQGPDKNPYSKPGPKVAVKKRPKRKVERQRRQKKKPTIKDYARKAEKVKSDPNVKAAEAIRKLEGFKEVVTQRKGLTALNIALVSILTKLAKKGVDIDEIRNADQLNDAIIKNGVELNLAEGAAVESLDRIANQSGPTAREVRNSWPGRVEAAQEASKGLSDKYLEYLNKNPTGTVALTIAGAAGIYLTYEGIKSIVKNAFAGKGADKKGGSWFRKELLIPLALMAAGGFLGKDVVKKIVKDAGLNYFDVEDKVKKGKKFSKDQKKKLKKAGKKIKKELDDRRRKKKGLPPVAAGPDEEPEPVPGALEPTKKVSKKEKLQKFGDELLVEKGADKLADGSYLVTTDKRKVYFKFDEDEGVWKWQSETQRKKKEWVDCGTDPYDEKKYPDTVEVNAISKSLASGAAKKETKADREAKEKLKKAVESSKYDLARDLFLTFYFRQREFGPAENRMFKQVINSQAGEKFSKIKSVYEKHKSDGKVDKSELKDVQADISDRHLFLLLERMVKFSKFAHIEADPDITVKGMFERAWANPLLDRVEGINQGVISALRDGNIEAAIATLAGQGIKFTKEQATATAKRLDEVAGLEIEHLSKEEKTAYRQLQVLLIKDAQVKQDPDKAVANILAAHKELAKYPKSVEAAKQFFGKVREKTPGILDKAYKRFEIKVDGKPNYLRKGVKFDSLSFSSATELVLLEAAMEGAGDDATDLMILNVLLRSFSSKQYRNLYISDLGDELVKDTPSLPAFKNLKRYLELAAKLAGAELTSWFLDLMQKGNALTTKHPTTKPSEAFAKQVKNEFILVSWGKEAAGTGLEITADALAVIVQTFNLEKDIADCENGKEFLDLIRVKGGNIAYYEERGSAPMILIEAAGHILIARPRKILAETFRSVRSIPEDPVEAWNAVKIWTTGSSFFVAFGAIKGFFKTGRGPDGRTVLALRSRAWSAMKGGARGLRYPYKAPLMAFGAAKRTMQTFFTGIEGARVVVRAPGEVARRTINWGKDVWRYGIPGQNVQNMSRTGWNLDYHLGKAEIPKTTTDVRARIRGAVQTMEDLAQSPGATFRRLTAGDFHWYMAQKNARRFAKQYNDFFRFDETSGLSLDDMTGDAIKNMRDNNYRRITGFMKQIGDDPDLANKILDATRQYKGEELVDKLNEILKTTDLNPNEKLALARRMKNTKAAKKILDQTVMGSETYAALRGAPNKPGALARLRERFRKPTGVEKARGFGKAKQALRNAQKELSAAQRKVTIAENEIGLLNRMRKGPKFKKWDAKLQARLDTARQIIADGNEARLQLETSIEALQRVEKAEDAIAKATKAGINVYDITGEGGKLLTELRTAEIAAEEALSTSSKALKNIGKLGKPGSFLKWGGRALGGVGVLFSAYEMQASFREAWNTDIGERKTIKYAESGLWALNVAADSAAVAVMLGSTSTAATVGSAVALPLIPITYAATTVGETMYEGTVTDYEWIQKGLEIQKGPYEALHHFYTSMNSVSLGDAWLGGFKAMGRSPVQLGMTLVGGVPMAVSDFSFETKGQKEAWNKSYDESYKTKVKTMHKIFRGLVAIQKDPSILDYINKTPPSKEKDKKVEQLIENNYSVYHEFYFRQMTPTGMQSYGTAQKFILEAQMFDKIMTMRDRAKEKKMKFRIVGKDKKHPFNLHLPRYDIIGGMDNPKARTIYSPSQVVQAYKEDLVLSFKKDEVIWDNLERMDTAYLLRLCTQIQLLLSDKSKAAKIDENVANALGTEYVAIKNYLEAVRGVDFELGIRNGALHKPLMTLDTILKHVNSLGHGANKAFLDFEKDNYTITPALHSIHKLAEYFGYTGTPSEIELKKFFNEDAAGYRGLYWDGSCWYLHARGKVMDEKLTPALTSLLVQRMIDLMRKYPNEMLKHRSDTIFLKAYDYEHEVKHMADILEGGLKEGDKRGYERSDFEKKQKEVAPPKYFNPKRIDYKQSKVELMKDYGAVIEYTKKSTLWSKLDYKIKDENSITLSRSDGDATVKLTRKSGGVWTLGDHYKSNLTLVQAVALGNLKNWAEQWLTSIEETGGSKRPFEVDGDVIDFDVWGSPVDRDFIRRWVAFYDEINISKEVAVETLNNWFEKEVYKG